MMKTTCKDCNKRMKAFCRTHDIERNTEICELIQNERYQMAGAKLIELKNKRRKKTYDHASL